MRGLAEVCILLALLGLIQCKVVINSTSLSVVRSSVGAIQSENKIFFTGGFKLNDYISSNVIDVYNLDENIWEPPMTLKHPRANLNPVILKEHLYLIGGRDYTNKPYIYNAGSSSFLRSATDPPSVRTINDISLHNSILTVVGKRSIDLLDITSGTWNSSEILHNIMASLVGPLVIPAEKYVFIIGGRNSTDQISDSLYIFNIETNTLVVQSTTLEIFVNPFASRDSRILTHFNNDVLVVNQDNTTLLYHVTDDQIKHLEATPIVYATTATNITFLFSVTRVQIFAYIWKNTTTNYNTILEEFLFPFGYGDYVGFIRPFANQIIFLQGYVTTSSPLPSNSIDWSGTVDGYVWAPDRYVFAGTDSVVVVNFYTLMSQSFNVGTIRKIFTTNDTLIIFAEQLAPGCIYATTETPTAFVMAIHPCLDIPDLVTHDSFLYLSAGHSVPWPAGNPIMSFEPITTTDLLIAQTDDQLIMMNKTPQVALSEMIEVYNHINGTWLDPIPMPSELIGDGENNLVATSLNDTVLAFFNTSQFRIHSLEQYELLEAADYSVTGNSFSYHVHSQVAAVVGNDVFMKSKNNSQHLLVYNSETGWRTTTPFPDGPILEPKQLFVHDKVIYMIAQNVETKVFNQVYLYYIDSQTWQITQHTPQSRTTAIMVGDFLALFADDGKMYSLHIPSGVWIEEDTANAYLFSSVVQVPSRGLTFASGATSFLDGTFSDMVLILTDDGIVPTVPQNVIDPSTQPAASNGDNTTLIVAIVVPVGAVAIAGGLLAFFLVRRSKKRKHGNASSAVGLEAKYGQWFTPFNQIKFGESIGQGANGQVFKGTWKNTTVALKVSMAQANSAVIGELELMMQMRPHPNVVQLFGFSVHPETDSIILIIEYCNQGSLDNTLFDHNRPITAEEKVKWIANVAKGLSHLHSNNIVHRDVAARNILLHQNEPKITDFGMSRLVDEDNKKGTTKSELGPIRWMAPEALRSKEYSTKSDVWSFGVFLYEIIAQQEPHSDADPIEVGRLIRDSGLTPVIPESCPTKLVSIVKQCWNMNPEQRPSIDQILRQLEEN